MRKLKQYLKARADIEKNLESIDKLIEWEQSKTVVFCTKNCHGAGCGKGTQIRNLTYIQTHWYERPYGCYCGDRWHEKDGEFICPKCGHRNRLYDRPEIQALKYRFKDIIKEYIE